MGQAFAISQKTKRKKKGQARHSFLLVANLERKEQNGV
jgi:hypothetical protein